MLVNMGPDSGRTGGSRQGRGDGPTPRARPKPRNDGAPRGSATARTRGGSGGGGGSGGSPSSRAGGGRSSDPGSREDRGSTRRSAPGGSGSFDRSSSGRGRLAPAAAKHGRPGSPRMREDAPASEFGGGAGNARRSSGGRADPRAGGDNRRPRPPAAGRTGGTSFSTRGQRDSFASRGPGPTAREPGHRAGVPRRDGPRPSYVPTERAARSPQGRRNDDGRGQGPDAGPRWGRSRDPLSRGSSRSAPFDRDDRNKDNRYKDDRYTGNRYTGNRYTGTGNRYTEDRRPASYDRGPGTYQPRGDRPFPRENTNRRTSADGTGREPSIPSRSGPTRYGSTGSGRTGSGRTGSGRTGSGRTGSAQRQDGRSSSFPPEGRWSRGGAGDYGPARDRSYGRSGAGDYRREGAPGNGQRSTPPGRSKEMPGSWGSVTRHGARSLSYDGPSASEIWSRARESAQGHGRNGAGPAVERTSDFAGGRERSRVSRPEADEWEIALVETRPAPARRDESKPTGRRAPATAGRDASRTARPARMDRTGRTARPAPRGVPSPTVDSRDEPGPAGNAKLEDATRAYSADRYQDALRIVRKVAAQAPNSAAVRELLGLTLYRLGRWPLAVRELEAHHGLSGSYDQYPVIADCYRAMGRYGEAQVVWEELRQASPSAEVVAEGRLVAAGCLADQGDLRGAVMLLEASLRRSRPKVSHLRQWYALADLYERAGELSRARDLFAQIEGVDPDAYDVRQRLVALG
jgi:hypothetical protein